MPIKPRRAIPPDAALTRLGLLPVAFSLFSVENLHPSAELPVDFTDTPTPIAAIFHARAKPAPCGAEDIKYFRFLFIGDVVNCLFSGRPSRVPVLDAQGKPTDRLNLPDFGCGK